MGEDKEYGVTKTVLELQEEFRNYFFEAVENSEISAQEYNALIDFVISDLENAPPFEEL